MSETESPFETVPETVPASAPVSTGAPIDHPVPFRDYAKTQRPKEVAMVKAGKPVMFKGRPVKTMTPGEPNEIWLKLLKINHGTEKHTLAEWDGLIDTYREQPAHPVALGTF